MNESDSMKLEIKFFEEIEEMARKANGLEEDMVATAMFISKSSGEVLFVSSSNPVELSPGILKATKADITAPPQEKLEEVIGRQTDVKREIWVKHPILVIRKYLLPNGNHEYKSFMLLPK